MKRVLLFLLSFLLLASLMLAVALHVHHSLPTGSDFNAVYTASVALARGTPIYDIPAVKAVAAEAAGVPVEQFFHAPFPYPPWYALSTFYLGLLPIRQAALLWFEINLVLLFLSLWFLTDGWNGRLRLVAFPLGLFFMPVLGALSVGQNVFPVLLGGSMLAYALRRENAALAALGWVLVTYKPHIGALTALSVLAWLIGSRSRLPLSPTGRFRRRATRFILLAGVFLFFVGFLADPAWHIRYPQMLLGIASINYGNESTGALCANCASLPVYLSRWLFDGTLTTASIAALILLVVLFAFFVWYRSGISNQPVLLLNLALTATLLVSPYLFNYDFILLLIPFAFLVDERKGNAPVLLVIFCYLVPTLAIIVYGRAGNVTLLAATIVLTILLYLRARSSVDVSARAA